MEPPMKPRGLLSKKIFFISLIFLFFFIGTILFSYNQNWFDQNVTMETNDTPIKIFDKKYSDSIDIYNQHGDRTDAINAFREILNDVPDGASEGKTKILLASGLYNRNEDGDRAEAISLYKSVANDLTMPLYVQALALNNIANVVIDENESFYKVYFSEAPFGTFMPKTGDGYEKVSRAYYEILKLSEETYPTSYAKYAIAGNYYAPALSDIKDNPRTSRLAGMNHEEVAKLMQTYIESGDRLHDDDLHILRVNLRKYLFRALAIDAIGRVLREAPVKTDDAFQKALLLGIEKDSNDVASEIMLMRIRLYFAISLLKNYGEIKHESIKNILDPFKNMTDDTDPASQAVQKFYMERLISEYNNSVKESSNELTNISPEFKIFVDSVTKPN